MAATGMPNFGASFAEAAYKLDLFVAAHFSPMRAPPQQATVQLVPSVVPGKPELGM